MKTNKRKRGAGRRLPAAGGVVPKAGARFLTTVGGQPVPPLVVDLRAPEFGRRGRMRARLVVRRGKVYLCWLAGSVLKSCRLGRVLKGSARSGRLARARGAALAAARAAAPRRVKSAA